jgi:hypothetical protein
MWLLVSMSSYLSWATAWSLINILLTFGDLWRRRAHPICRRVTVMMVGSGSQGWCQRWCQKLVPKCGGVPCLDSAHPPSLWGAEAFGSFPLANGVVISSSCQLDTKVWRSAKVKQLIPLIHRRMAHEYPEEANQSSQFQEREEGPEKRKEGKEGKTEK